MDCTTAFPAEYINSIIVVLVLKKWHNTSIRRRIKYIVVGTYQYPRASYVNRTIRHGKVVCVLAFVTALWLDLIGIFFCFALSLYIRPAVVIPSPQQTWRTTLSIASSSSSSFSTVSVRGEQPTALKQSYIWTPAFDLNCTQWAGIDLRRSQSISSSVQGRSVALQAGVRAGSCGMSLADKRTRRQNTSDVQIIHLFQQGLLSTLSQQPCRPVRRGVDCQKRRETAIKMRVFHLKRYDTTLLYFCAPLLSHSFFWLVCCVQPDHTN